MMLHPLAPPPSFPFHVVEVMSSQRYHLKRKLAPFAPAREAVYRTLIMLIGRYLLQNSATWLLLWHSHSTLKR